MSFQQQQFVVVYSSNIKCKVFDDYDKALQFVNNQDEKAAIIRIGVDSRAVPLVVQIEDHT